MSLARLLTLVIALLAGHGALATAEFETLIESLPKASFKKKTALVDKIVATNHERSSAILDALMNGQLHRMKSDGQLVIRTGSSPSYSVHAAATGKPLGQITKRESKKIRTNNGLRKHIRDSLSLLHLTSPNPIERQAAAMELVASKATAAPELLRRALAKEADAEVRSAISLALARIDVDSPNETVQLLAISNLAGSLHPQAANVLRSVAHGPVQANRKVTEAAAETLRDIENQLMWYRQVENLFFGLSLGSVLLLAAIGLAITFGVMGVINMAHGEMVMLGAYTTYVVQTVFPDLVEASILIAIPAAFLIAGLVGIVIERTVICHLYGRPLETLLATFGVSLILQQTVRSVFSPLNRSVSTPSWMSGSLDLNPALSLTYNRLYIIVFAILVLIGLAVLLKHSRFGLEVRAVTQNRNMARAMGIRTARVDALTFGLGSGVAGMAGVALSQLTNVGPNMGQAYIVDSFMVVVFGGVGNLLGTFFGAMTLGVANKFLEPYAGAVLAKIAILVFIILFIQRRPQGLFALHGRAET
ncbi:MAG: urea ABC transporter permease subunit UrtB [Chromatiales bacterium]|jgi:urea transport system permease protein|nr:urea ABC transporter permease subunit UrtB [Chromatiales bacterium]